MALAPIVDGIEHEYAGRIRVIRVDIHLPDSRPMMNHYRFPGTPYLIFENAQGEIIFRRGGVRTVESIRNDLRKLL
jgi:hypothetical protein